MQMIYFESNFATLLVSDKLEINNSSNLKDKDQ